ncbi:MAG TPA: YfiR family protein [Candidatus Acidoferrum sp.]|nr:YfiR family protein [Candidatus Acidoferrum sp.]
MKFKRKSWRPAIPLLALAWLTVSGAAAARDSVALEYQVKAAFLFNFGKFVSWPAADFTGTNAPLVIGVLGNNPFHGDLKNMIAGKNIEGHPVVFRQFMAPEAVRNCNILFVSQSAQKDAPAIFAALRGAKVLTVTENLPHLAGSGFEINFVLAQDNIRFEINSPAVAQAGLAISSKLMSLALPPEP